MSRVAFGSTTGNQTLLPNATRVGFIGLGRMGAPMAARLAGAGFEVVAYDADSAARARVTANGLPVAASAADAARTARVVALCLPDSGAVHAVLHADGVLDAMPKGALLLDLGSSEPLATRSIAAEAAVRGLRVVDAPVSGGVSGALAGSLTVMTGGSPEDVASCDSIFEAIGQHVVYVGPVGAGHAMKALNNLLSATTLLATSEAISTAAAFGIDAQTFLDVVNTSSGRSYSTEVKFPKFIVGGSYGSGFGLRLMAKDARTALALAQNLGTPTAVASTVVEAWERSAAALPPDADHTQIAEWVGRGAPTD